MNGWSGLVSLTLCRAYAKKPTTVMTGTMRMTTTPSAINAHAHQGKPRRLVGAGVELASVMSLSCFTGSGPGRPTNNDVVKGLARVSSRPLGASRADRRKSTHPTNETGALVVRS